MSAVITIYEAYDGRCYMRLRADEEAFAQILADFKSWIDPCYRHYAREDRVWVIAEKKYLQNWLKRARRSFTFTVQYVDRDGSPIDEHSGSERQYRRPDYTPLLEAGIEHFCRTTDGMGDS